ncbi:alpha/beta hydrolase [Rufibacter immobilis]|uniref:Alpha/beta hydrolase n=1 Tax=Rufibacter immobilis TaxID=1348778 RepID=A0A3M9MNR9_9BACT|nr:alpha/beta hydrolase [Rufibacter immobilis]RNI27161.1 alpha/beta hydrolase [Rufibacter immobilis]
MEMLIPASDAKLFTIAPPNPGKETIILLHGGPGVPDGLTFLRRYLGRDFHVVFFHQRGTLRSPVSAQDFAMERYVADINRIADHFGVEKFHLLGHSWGGLYAQLYAQRHPSRLLSLFLCSPASGTGRQWAETMLEVGRYNFRKSRLLEFMAMQVNTTLGLLGSNRGYRRFFRQALANFSRGFQEVHPEHFSVDCIRARTINRTVKSILTHQTLPDVLHTPFNTTITYGDKDIFGDSKRYVLRRFPEASVQVIPGSGHIPWSHNPQAFLPVLDTHFAR